MLGIKFTKRIIIGLAFIYLAGLGWIAEIAVPFLPINHKTAIFTFVLIAAELIFLAGVAVLGKPIYIELKSKLTEYVRTKTKK